MGLLDGRVPIPQQPAGKRVDTAQIRPFHVPAVNGIHLTIASPNLITFTDIQISASPDTHEWVVEMTPPVVRAGDAAMNTIEVAQQRFVEVAYPRTLKAGHFSITQWKSAFTKTRMML